MMGISKARQTAVTAWNEAARLARAENVAAAVGIGGRARALQAKVVNMFKLMILVHDDNPSTLRSWTRQTKIYITAFNIHLLLAPQQQACMLNLMDDKLVSRIVDSINGMAPVTKSFTR
jgi:hypothetical protein